MCSSARRPSLMLLAIVAVACAASCSRSRDDAVPLASHGPALMSHEKLQARRAELQERELAEYRKCPDCYRQRVVGTTRSLKFDAIVDCASTYRAGRMDDGGKWLCNPDQITKGTIVYGFGVANDYSFDKEMAEVFGAEVHMFDPGPNEEKAFADLKTPRKFGEGTVTYHPIGLGPVSDEPAHAWDLQIEGKKCEVKSLADLAKNLGHTHVDILKIDIEGGEYASLRQMLDTRALRSLGVRQLLVEFHFVPDEHFTRFLGVIDSLNRQGYKLFRKELNPFGPINAAEYAFVLTRR